ncbi:hypothetical protein MBLNU13_g11381t1 [Cladosporium sp. NU13]
MTVKKKHERLSKDKADQTDLNAWLTGSHILLHELLHLDTVSGVDAKHNQIADQRFDSADGVGPYVYGPKRCEKYADKGGRTLLNVTGNKQAYVSLATISFRPGIMKVIITGATGRIGGAVLQSALSNPAITNVVVLSRRDIDIQHAKLQTIIKKDYTHYKSEELAQLEGAEGCIWALGAPTSNIDIHVQYPLAAQRAFATSLVPKTPSGKPFRFVILSGAAIIRDQTTRLPPGLSGLKRRGQVEQDFVDFEAQNQNIWKSFIARPRMVIMPGSWVSWAIPGGFQIPVEVLGAALVSIAVRGEAEQTLDNAALTSIGRDAMAKK